MPTHLVDVRMYIRTSLADVQLDFRCDLYLLRLARTTRMLEHHDRQIRWCSEGVGCSPAASVQPSSERQEALPS